MTNEQQVRERIVKAWAMGEYIVDELTELSPSLGRHLLNMVVELEGAIEVMQEKSLSNCKR